MSLEDFSKQQEGFIKKLVDEQKGKEISPPKNQPKCPKCNKPLKRIFSKNKGKYYWVCSDKDCDAFFFDEKGKPNFNPVKKRGINK